MTLADVPRPPPAHPVHIQPTWALIDTDSDTRSRFDDILVLERWTSRCYSELPDQVDTEKDGGLLAKFGIDPSQLMGGLGDKLGASPKGYPD
jgi:hypothetical protein